MSRQKIAQFLGFRHKNSESPARPYRAAMDVEFTEEIEETCTNRLMFERLQRLDAEEIEASLTELGFSLPPAEQSHFMPRVLERFPTITERGWSAKFGVKPDVLEAMWRRYYWEFLTHKLEPLDILLYFNKMATNQVWDEIATNWALSRTSVYRKVTHARQVLASVLDEVRSF